MKLLILIFVVIYLANARKVVESESSDSSTEITSSETTDNLNLSYLKKSIKFSQKDELFIKSNFDVSNMELMEPKKEAEISKYCIINTKLKDKEDKVQVKIAKAESIKAWYSKEQEKSLCSSEVKNDKLNKLIPIEYHVSKELLNKPRITKFYPEQSRFQNGLAILTTQNYANSENLSEWYDNQKKNLDHKEMEKMLKILFSQAHNALSSLLEKKFLYTDFKPENLIVNKNNKKGSIFLTNLNSAISLSKANKLDKICVMTTEYFPPVIGESDHKRLTSMFIKSEGQKAAKRILSWQFCMSLFSLVCKEFDEKKSQFADRSIFSKWKNENAALNRYFKCPSSKISNSLNSLFESCLYKKSNHANLISFEKLIDHEWFKS